MDSNLLTDANARLNAGRDARLNAGLNAGTDAESQAATVAPAEQAAETNSQTPNVPQARPTSASQIRVRWDYVIVFGVTHVLALLIFVPYFFSWTAVACFAVSVFVFGLLGIPIAFHRMLAHKSFKSPKWFERTLVTLAMCTAQETPARWVAWHRKHHNHSDEQEDPHSPRVSFFWSHLDWLFHENISPLATFFVVPKVQQGHLGRSILPMDRTIAAGCRHHLFRTLDDLCVDRGYRIGDCVRVHIRSGTDDGQHFRLGRDRSYGFTFGTSRGRSTR